MTAAVGEKAALPAAESVASILELTQLWVEYTSQIEKAGPALPHVVIAFSAVDAESGKVGKGLMANLERNQR